MSDALYHLFMEGELPVLVSLLALWVGEAAGIDRAGWAKLGLLLLSSSLVGPLGPARARLLACQSSQAHPSRCPYPAPALAASPSQMALVVEKLLPAVMAAGPRMYKRGKHLGAPAELRSGWTPVGAGVGLQRVVAGHAFVGASKAVASRRCWAAATCLCPPCCRACCRKLVALLQPQSCHFLACCRRRRRWRGCWSGRCRWRCSWPRLA